MKLFTKSIDNKLFAQFPKGGSLEGQKVIAKIFNPYGRGRWYIMNSDPEDPDYLWGIVELFDGEPEVGSFSRSELENLRVGAFKLGLERDLYFDPMDAMEVYRGLKMGNKFEEGGTLEDSTYLARMAEEYAEREYGKKAKPESTVVRASKLPNGKNYYTEITVFFTDGSKQTFEQKDFEEFFDVDDYAKGGTLKVIKDADKNQGRLYYERFNGAIGSFAWRYDKNYNEGILYPLDDFDREFYSHLKLKESEMLFRYKTDNMLGMFFPLIKINLDKMLVYFLEDSDDDKNPTFDSRGTKLEYLAIEEFYYEVREFAKGGKLEYTSKRNITNVTIKYEGKEYLVSGDDVITGAYKFDKGGLSDTHIYIPKRDVIKVTTKEGESINSPLNGVWVKKEYFERKESKSSGSYEPSQATKVFAYKLKELAKDKETTASMKDSMVESLSFVDDFVNDLKYEIENNISGLAIETYAKAVKFVSKKNKKRVGKNLPFYGNADVIKLFPEEFTKTTILSKKAIPMKGNLLNNEAYLKELGNFTSDDALRPAMTSIRFDGKDIVATDAHILVHLYQDESVEPQNLCVTKVCETSGGKDQRYPDWKAIITKNLNDSKFKNQTFDLDKLIVLVNWINNYYSVWDNYTRTVAITTKDGDIAFNPEKLLKVLTMLKVMGVKKPIMYYESGNRAVYFGEESKLSGDPMYDNFILLMPLLSASAESFSLDLSNNEYKIVVPSFAKGGELKDDVQLELFAKGGATFDDKVRAIKRNLVGKKVPKDYQDEYGKRYDKNEAEESARRIAGAMQRNYKK